MVHRTIRLRRLCGSFNDCKYQFLLPFLTIMFLTITLSTAQPAKNANKFLGNITTRGQIPTDFMEYWNHITGENESKWLSVEGSRNVMNWTGCDRIASFAREKKIPWRFHSLFNYGSYPGWMANIPDTTLLREMGEWMDSAAARYPDVTMIDVFNECYDHNLPGIFRTALGGNGVTGFDWAIKAFKMARERWPHALLIYNDYGNIEYEANIKWTIDLVTTLKQANAPVDIIGCEANFIMNLTTSKVKANIDRIAETGLPVYISAFEIGTNSDSLQESLVREKFTMLWNHPKVIGITYWGYIVGQTWRSGTGLLTGEDVERPALTWLKNFVKDNPNPPNDFPHLLDKTTKVNSPVISSYHNNFPVKSIVKERFGIFDLQGRHVGISCGNPALCNTQKMRTANGLYMVQLVDSDNKSAGLKPVIRMKSNVNSF